MLMLSPLLDRTSEEHRRRYSVFISSFDPSGSDYGEIAFNRNQRSLDGLLDAKLGPPWPVCVTVPAGEKRHGRRQISTSQVESSQRARLPSFTSGRCRGPFFGKIIPRFLPRFSRNIVQLGQVSCTYTADPGGLAHTFGEYNPIHLCTTI